MGVIYRGHRKSPKSQNVTRQLDHRVTEGVCQLLLTGTQSLPSPWTATKPG